MIGLQYTPYTIPLILTAAIAGLLAFAVWNRRPGPGVSPFVILMLAVAEWTIANTSALVFADPTAKAVSLNLAYIGITIVPAAWLVFVLEYTGREHLVTRRNLLLLTIEPMLVQVAIWTNPIHHLFWSTIDFIKPEGFWLLDSTANGLFWVHAVYSYLLIVIAAVMLVYTMVRSPALYRGQAVTLLIGVVIGMTANVLTIFKVLPFPYLDITPFSFTFLGIMIAISMLRYRLMDITPIARDRVFIEMRDAVMIVDEQNRIIDINRAALELIGLASVEEAVGKRGAKVLSQFPDLVAQYGNLEQAQTEISVQTHTQIRHFQLTVSPLRRHNGTLQGRIFALHEITELKQAVSQIQTQNDLLMQTNRDLAKAQALAEEASRLKSEFLATMSHELRTPLNAIIGFTDFMLAGVPGTLSEKQIDYLKRVNSNGERLLALINDILDIAKIEAARFDLADVVFSPADLLNTINSQLRGLAEQKGLRFDTHFDAALPSQLRGDPKRLEQILVNLIGNAVRFTEKGSVNVTFGYLEPSQWALIVTDTGIGIPAHALDFIFEEFRQVDGSTRREHGGTGLGLAIVHKLALLMGGQVQVKSEIGKGSTFTVQLPIKLPESPVQVV